MKNLVYLCIAFAISITSCSKSSDPESTVNLATDIKGTWNYKSNTGSFQLNGASGQISGKSSDLSFMAFDSIKFNSDGKSGSYFAYSEPNPFTYTLSPITL